MVINTSPVYGECTGKVFGPVHFSRHDLTVLTIMRGRDHGVLDYNSARLAYGLPAVTKWTDVNPWLNAVNPSVGVIILRTCSIVHICFLSDIEALRCVQSSETTLYHFDLRNVVVKLYCTVSCTNAFSLVVTGTLKFLQSSATRDLTRGR